MRQTTILKKVKLVHGFVSMLCVLCVVVQRSVSRESEGYFSHNQSISHSQIRVLMLAAEDSLWPTVENLFI